MTAVLAALGRFLVGLVEVIDRRLDSRSYRWGWR